MAADIETALEFRRYDGRAFQASSSECSFVVVALSSDFL